MHVSMKSSGSRETAEAYGDPAISSVQSARLVEFVVGSLPIRRYSSISHHAAEGVRYHCETKRHSSMLRHCGSAGSQVVREMNKIVSADELADLLGLSRRAIADLVRTGHVVRVGRNQ